MKRNDFLKTALLGAASISTFGFVTNTSDGPKGDCSTTNDILGPFYRPEAPIRKDLSFKGLEGNKVMVKGRVFGDDCTTPLKNAQVEIWHCDTEGRYDNETSEFRLRGRQMTDGKGEYSFKTILPGKYLNGRQYRPAHIHFRVTADRHQELISQIYFQGDPHIEKDPWASHPSAELRVLPVSLEDTHGNLVVNFDIYLKA
mgnify:FL=1